MSTSNADKLKMMILENIGLFARGGWEGRQPQLPSFELYARDYLEFAEHELNNNTTVSLINCVTHLKRALDCQLDTFLHVYNLFNLFNKKNLKVDKKLNFIKEIGVFNSRSLSRLNTIRNKVEHRYEIPKIQDLEVYYDLISAFIALLQSTINLDYDKLEFSLLKSEYERIVNYDDILKLSKTNSIGYFTIEYLFGVPSIHVFWTMNDKSEDLVSDATKDYNEFAFFFKVFLLLRQRDSFASDRYILSQLNSNEN